MVTNYNALGVHAGAETLAMNVRVNRKDKVKPVSQASGASAQKNCALRVRQLAPELDRIDLAGSRHAPIV